MGRNEKNVYVFFIQESKKAVRIITCSPATAHSAPIFHKLKILPIEKLYLLFVNLFMYKFVTNCLPDIFSDIAT